MYAVGVVGFEGCGSQPAVIVEVVGHAFGCQVGLADPEELPVEAGVLAHGHGQGPSEESRHDELLDRLHRGLHPVEVVLEAEPGVEAEHPSVLPDGFHDPLAFPDRSGHGLLAPDVFSGPRGFHGHDAVPVGRCGDVDDVDFGKLDEFAVVVEGLHTSTHHLPGFLEVVLVDIAEGHDACAFVGDVSPSHTAGPDDALGELVARWDVSFAEHVSRNDEEACRSGRGVPQEAPSSCMALLAHSLERFH